MSETEIEGPDPTLSPDARDSTYAPAPDDDSLDNNPPLGPRVLQTPGKPGDGQPTPSASKTSTKSSSTSSSTS
jgi:hypothetical protein